MANNLRSHPSVLRLQERETRRPAAPMREGALDAEWLRQLCLEAGADAVGFVSLGRPELDDQREDILRAFPQAQALISFVCRVNRTPVRSPARSVANLELHRVRDDMDALGHQVVATLERHGISALNPATSYPMEMDHFPGKTWVVGHKPVAVAAGLGRMGIHRNVIHPVFGNFILLGTIVVGMPISEEGQPIDYNPCLECKLCVAVCPVGAIGPEGQFNFSACYTHNYREFKGGFTDWVETIAESKNAADYRRRVDDSESASMWQSLSSGANYKASYCIAACPAGEDVIEPFLADRKAFLDDVVHPLQQKVEPIYVTPGSDAELYVQRRFPHKRVRRVGSSLRVTSIAGFLRGITLKFQKNRAGDLAATYHFTFTGAEPAEATVVIRDGTIQVERGLAGTPDVRVTADSATWVRFARKETPLLLAILRRKVRVQGPLRLLKRFGKCFV